MVDSIAVPVFAVWLTLTNTETAATTPLKIRKKTTFFVANFSKYASDERIEGIFAFAESLPTSSTLCFCYIYIDITCDTDSLKQHSNRHPPVCQQCVMLKVLV